MKKTLLKLLIASAFILFSNKINATHIMGGEIVWECLNNGQYIFTLKVYRDCNGISYNTNNLAIEAHNYPNTGSITLIPVSFFSVTDITPSCEGSVCAEIANGTVAPGVPGAIEEYVMKSAPVTLAGVPPNNGWAFTWTSGNRNAAIDNINNASTYGITLRALMFPYNGQNANLCFDSSPDFYQKPSTIICAGERFTYNHSAFDNELDSLSYEWARPLEGTLCNNPPCRIGGVFSKGTNPPVIPFDAGNGYSFDSPYPDTSQDSRNVPAVLNPSTGEITFTSYNQGEFVSVIKVTAYKCGQKVAEIYRELQTVITSGCASNEPPVITPLTNNTYSDTVKVGDTVRFRINILDSIRADNPNVDSLFIFASGQQFGANFTDPNSGCLNPPCAILSSPLPDTGVGRYTTDFFWETSCSHIQNTTPICYSTANSYQFVIRAFDDFCPAAGQTIATYTITILADSLVENPDMNCANVLSNGDVIIDWDGISDPDGSFSAYMIYVSDFRNGPYTLIDSIFDSTITSYTHIGAGANNNSKHYIVRVRSGCQAGWTILPADTVSTLYIEPILNDSCLFLSWNSLNDPLPNGSDSVYSIYREYPIGSGFVLFDSTNSLNFCDNFNLCTDTVTYRIELSNSGNDCSGSSSNTRGIRFNYPEPVPDFTATTPCGSLNISFFDNTNINSDSIASYLWDFGDQTGSNLENPSHTYNSPGTYDVTLTVTTIKGCIDSITKPVTPDIPFVSAGNDTAVCLKDSVVIGGSPTSATLNVTYSWTPTTGIADPSVANPMVSPSDTITYTVVVTNSNGCTNSDTVTVFVKPLPTVDAGLNRSICIDDSAVLGGNPTSSTSGVSYSWLPGNTLNDPSIANPTAFPTSTQIYSLNVLAPNGCSDTSSIKITVNPLPQADAGTDKNICTRQDVLIGGSPSGPLNATYSWTPTTNISSPVSANPTVSPTNNTTYFVEVTDTNGCVAIDSVNIILQPTPIADAGADQTICKEDFPYQLNGSVSVSNSGRWIGGTGTFSPNRNILNPTYQPSSAEISSGLVELQLISTANGICDPDTDLVRINIPAFTGIIALNTTAISCFGLSDGTAGVSVNGSNNPYSFRWSSAPSQQTGSTVSGLSVGNYFLTVTNNLGCDSIIAFTITQPNLLLANMGTTTDVSCNGGNDGTANVTVSGGTTPYIYAWPSGTNTANEGSLAQGSYIVTVTDNNGCSDTALAKINEPTLLVATINATADVSCNGGNDGTANVTASGGTTPYTYAWPSGTNTANEGSLAQGSYIVTVTDNNGCSDTALAVINEPVILIATINATTDVSCNGGNDGTANVTASGGTASYTYAWPSGNNTANEGNLAQGSYIVTVTDNKGCSDTTLAVINEPTLLVATINAITDVSCNGGNDGTASVTASGGTAPYTYAWPSGTNTANEGNLAQASYIVTVTDNKGCSDTALAVINEPTLLVATINATTDVSCNGGNDGTANVTASGGTAPYTYAWPSGTSTTNEGNLAQGSYIVTVTDNKGCSDTALAVINEPTLLVATINAITDVSCNGGNDGTASVTASGGTAPYTYAWPSGTSTTNEGNLAQGSYIITVTDDKGCSDTALAVINEPTVLMVTISSKTDVSCNNGSDGTATATASGGTAPYTYAWPSGNTTVNEINLARGAYIATVTDNKGCSDTALVVIDESDSLIISAVMVPVSCFGLNDGSITVNASGGNDPYIFNWSNNVQDSVNNNLSAGNYGVTVTDASGCVLDSSFLIQEPSPFTLNVSPDDTICIGDFANIQATAIGGNTTYTYNWNQNLGNAGSHQVNPTTTTRYLINITDEKGCSSNQDSILIAVRDIGSESLFAFSNGNICEGQSTTVYATHSGKLGPYTYTWSDNLGSNLGPYTVSPTTTTDYWISATDACGVVISDTVQVTVEPYPIINLPSIIETGCEPLTVVFQDTLNDPNNNYAYLWDFGDGNSTTSRNTSYTYSSEGQYSIQLKVTSPGNCETNSTTQSLVIVHPSPRSNFSMSTNETDIENAFVNFSSTSTNTDNVSWNFYNSLSSSAIDTTLEFLETGLFKITLYSYNNFGCIDSSFKFLKINPVYKLITPNAFTPNSNGGSSGYYNKNDLSNDIFYIHLTEAVQSYELLIFNRWGEMVFETKDANQGWDGYYLGKLSPQDVYVYKVSVVWLTGKRTSKVGNFTLFR